MDKTFIDGELFEKIMINGGLNLKAHLNTVNELNVFPIPDGDTGDNMYMTYAGGVDYMRKEKSNSVGKKACALAKGMLLNARGNSGVILSQLYFGFSESVKDCEEITVLQLMEAFKHGVKYGYKAVVNPVEGTMLTVAREAAEYTTALDFDAFFDKFLDAMKKSLEHTPDLLITLKEAGVVDSGGAGLVYIAEGMKDAMHGKMRSEDGAFVQAKSVDIDKFTKDDVVTFGYCTEIMLRLQTSKVDVDAFDENVIIDYLTTIGESVVAFKTDSVVKIHVHTLTPYKVLEFCQKFGEYLTVKIENMNLQHNENVKDEEEDEIITKIQRARRKYAVITVANGDGVISLFNELGVDVVIDGGQGKNPSIEDFINAFDEVNADHIYVFPNNSNIILAAKQARDLYDKSNVIVIESKNIGMAYSALSMLDFSIEDPQEVEDNFICAMGGSVTAMVSRAIRNATVSGIDVSDGQFIGFTDKTAHNVGENRVEVLHTLLKKLNIDEKAFVILFYGDQVSESEKAEINEIIAQYTNVEFYPIDGNQEVYDFVAILE